MALAEKNAHDHYVVILKVTIAPAQELCKGSLSLRFVA